MADGDDPQDDSLIQSRADGQLHFAAGTEAFTFPVTAPENATPLEEDEPEGVIPPSPLWAMKDRLTASGPAWELATPPSTPSTTESTTA
jgi:hypothetical protein